MNALRPSLLLGLVGMLLTVPPIACMPASNSADSPPATAQSTSPTASTLRLPRAVLDDGASFTLELAVTPEEVSQGLMFRPSLAEDRGMLFLFEVERVPSFWMRHTLIPLDLLFLDGEGSIVEIFANAQPCAAEPCPQYIPARAVWAVLEVNAGTASRHRLAVGDRIVFERVPGYPK